MQEPQEIDFHYRQAFDKLERFNYRQWKRVVSRVVAGSVFFVALAKIFLS